MIRMIRMKKMIIIICLLISINNKMSTPLCCIGKECRKTFKTKGRYSNHILTCLSYKLYYSELKRKEAEAKLKEVESKLKETVVVEDSTKCTKCMKKSDSSIVLTIQLPILCKGYESLLCFSSIEETNFVVVSCLKKYNMFDQFNEECDKHKISLLNGIKILLKQCIGLYNPTNIEKIAFANLVSKDYPFSYPNYLEQYHKKIRWVYEIHEVHEVHE